MGRSGDWWFDSEVGSIAVSLFGNMTVGTGEIHISTPKSQTAAVPPLGRGAKLLKGFKPVISELSCFLID